MDPTPYIEHTRQWLEKAVIGLNLCPFARAPYIQGRVHFQVSAARTPEALLDELVLALQELAAMPADSRETTLLIHPWVLTDFADYNDFLAVADQALAVLELEGVIQIASFHPRYQFADTTPEAIDNYSNRSPYPILHLLREDSVAWAADRMADPDEIYRNNIHRLRALGKDGWRALWSDETKPPPPEGRKRGQD